MDALTTFQIYQRPDGSIWWSASKAGGTIGGRIGPE